MKVLLKHKLIMLVASISMTCSALAEGVDKKSRMENSHEEFAALLSSAPGKEVDAEVYFKETMPWQNVRDSVYLSKLKIRGFRFGNEFYSGSYSFKAGESIDEGFRAFQEAHEAELIWMLDDNTRERVGQTDPDRIRSLNNVKETLDIMLEGLRSGGNIIALKVRGAASEIANFRDRAGYVRLVELVTVGFSAPAIMPRE